MKNIFGFLTVAIFSVVVSTFAQAEDSVGVSAVAESTETKRIMSMMDRVIGEAPQRSLVLESTAVLKGIRDKRGVAASHQDSVDVSLSVRETGQAIKNMYILPSGRSIILNSTNTVIYAQDGHKIREIPLSYIYVASNNKYFVAVNWGKTKYFDFLPPGDSDAKPVYIEFYDENATLLWKRRMNNLAEIGQVVVSPKGHVLVTWGKSDLQTGSLSLFDVTGKDITPASLLNGDSYTRLVFSAGGDYYSFVELKRDKQNKNPVIYAGTLRFLSIKGEEVYSHQLAPDSSSQVKAVVDTEDFVFATGEFRASKCKYYHLDTSRKRVQSMDGFEYLWPVYAQALSNEYMVVITYDAFSIWDLQNKRVFSSHLLINGGVRGGTIIMDAVKLNGKFVVLATTSHWVTKGKNYFLVFDLQGNLIAEKYFANETRRNLHQYALSGNTLLWGDGDRQLYLFEVH